MTSDSLTNAGRMSSVPAAQGASEYSGDMGRGSNPSRDGGSFARRNLEAWRTWRTTKPPS